MIDFKREHCFRIRYSKADIAVPGYILLNGKKYELTYTHPNYHIRKFYVKVVDIKNPIIKDIIICNSFHPNAYGGEEEGITIDNPPKMSLFCIPNSLRKTKLVKEADFEKILKGELERPKYPITTLTLIKSVFLCAWALDNPHHIPHKDHFKSNPEL